MDTRTYTHTSTNAGCTNTVTLNLTINKSTTLTETKVACDLYNWPSNGVTYMDTGTYTDINTNEEDCPHTNTLDLTINDSTTSTVNITACHSYTWIDGVTYTTSGTYKHINAGGCNTTTLNLKINNCMSEGIETGIAAACAGCTVLVNQLQQGSGVVDSRETKIVKKSTKTTDIVKQSAIAGALAASASILINKLSSKTTNTESMAVKAVLFTPVIYLLL
jgi:hypothetical protein